MLLWGLQFCLGLLVANAGEWFIHRYLLHGLGKHPDSFWAYHIYQHHHIAGQLNMLDPGYKKRPYLWNIVRQKNYWCWAVFCYSTRPFSAYLMAMPGA